ncbi:MAG: protein kinase [Gemmatimonadales bacterium]|jgi:serine/threonine-protein kinase|nr:MAG: protein kinase [Gemmatimonadales bacterium]
MTQYSLQELQGLLPERYEAQREIAQGGMSRVYLAREKHPERLVALKIMDTRLSEGGRSRFLQEVNVTSKLSHPHIVPIFAAGEVGDSLYYAMPFIQGDTLADRIRKEGPLSVEEAVRITLEVARALHYAHEQGVVHRDVKPDNIHFRDGHALVADFGIARALGEAADRITDEGHTLGTVEYMAPEQASGSDTVDTPADQYALACVLFEMLTGEPPFQGRTPQSTLARHLSGTVPSMRALRSVIPEEIEAVVNRALQKLPRDRYPTTADFAQDLGAAIQATHGVGGLPRTGSHPRAPHRGRRRRLQVGLAVLAVVVAAVVILLPPGEPPPPLEANDGYLTSVAVLSPEGQVVGSDAAVEAEVIGDALASEITSTLAAVPWLDVRSYYSSRVLADAQLSASEILDSLDVEHLIQVNLVLQGDRVGIGIGYVGEDERQRPGLRRDLRLGDWFDEQPRIAQQVAQDFTQLVGADEAIALRARATPGPGYRDYQIGNEFLGRRTPREVRRAIDSYWSAIEKDPSYGPAYAKLSQAYALALTYRYEVGVDEYTAAGLAHALATRGIEASPQVAEGYAARSYIRSLAASPAELAAIDIERARNLEPNNPAVPSWSARVHTLQGDLERAYEEVLRGAELDPLHSGRQIAVAYQAFHVGRHEEAVTYSDIALELEPELMLPRVLKARSLVLLGRPEDCLQMELGPHEGTRALCLWASGARDEARRLVDSLVRDYPSMSSQEFTPVLLAEDLAVFHGYSGDADEALRWIEVAYEHSPTGVELRVLESDLFDPVRDAPGFQTRVDQMRTTLWGRVETAWTGPVQRPGSA